MATSGSRCHRSSSRNLLTKVPRWPPPAAAAVIFSLFAIAKYTALRMKKHHKVPWPLFQTAVTVSHTHIGHLDMTPSLPPQTIPPSLPNLQVRAWKDCTCLVSILHLIFFITEKTEDVIQYCVIFSTSTVVHFQKSWSRKHQCWTHPQAELCHTLQNSNRPSPFCT